MGSEGYDRIARLVYVLHILNYNPHGLKANQIAEQCGVDIRTTYRDLHALEDYAKVALWQDNGRWGLPEGAFLPPVSFTVPEAMAIFMAARLLLSQSSVYNRDIETAFQRLGGIVPVPLRNEIRKTLAWMGRRKPNEQTTRTLNELSRCWTQRRCARIRYWTLNRQHAVERVIEPYFIQPAALEHAIYVIAFCHMRGEVRIFRLDRIHDVRRLDDEYEIPDDFDANVYLSPYWGITATGEPQTIRLRFHPDVARIAQETLWHDSQVTEPQMDGSAIVTMRLAITTDLISFILGWSDMVEVLAPQALRRKVMAAARRIYCTYGEQDTIPSFELLPLQQPSPLQVPKSHYPPEESQDLQLDMFDDL